MLNNQRVYVFMVPGGNQMVDDHDGLMALDPRSFLNYIRGTM
jgi:hypothetical protein